MKRLGYLMLFSISALCLAKNGAVFETLPISTNNSCESLIFKGRNDYKDTAFIMPKVKIAHNQNGDPIAHLIQLSSDTYQFRFSLEFRNEIDNCDTNNLLEELRDYPHNSIQRISELIFDNIEVSIDDLDGRKVLLADQGSTLFDIQGIKNVVFDIEGQRQIQKLKKLLKSKTGIEVDLSFILGIKSQDAKINCSLDSSLLELELNAEIKGKAYIEIAQFELALNRTIKKSSSSCSIESGSLENSKSITQIILNKIRSEISTSFVFQDPAEYKNSSQSSPSHPSGNAPQPSKEEIERKVQAALGSCKAQGIPDDQLQACLCRLYPTAPRCGKNSLVQQDQATISQQCINENGSNDIKKVKRCICEKNTNATFGEDSCSNIDATFTPHSRFSKNSNAIGLETSLVTKFLKQNKKINIDVDYLTPEATQKISTSFILRQNSSPDEFSSFSVSNKQNKAKEITQRLYQGFQIEIYPTKEIIEELITNQVQNSYYSKDQLRDISIKKHYTKQSNRPFIGCSEDQTNDPFPSLDSILPKKIEEKDKVAYSKKIQWNSSSPYSAFGGRTYLYRWGHTSYEYHYQLRDESNFEFTRLNQFIQLPLKIRFAELPVSIFTMEDLIENKYDYWDIHYNQLAQSIILTAKKDLGEISFFNNHSTTMQTFSPLRHFIERNLGNQRIKKCSPLDDKALIPLERSELYLNYRIIPKEIKINDLQTRVELSFEENSLINPKGKNE